jgi:putative hemolysin
MEKQQNQKKQFKEPELILVSNHTVVGDCSFPGTGNSSGDTCGNTGVAASGNCITTGGNAANSCSETGGSATTFCINSGGSN